MKTIVLRSLILTTLTITSSICLANGSAGNASTKVGAWTVYSGTIVNNLSVDRSSSKSNINEVSFPQPGQLQFTAPLFCGDGDVAHYYQENTQEDYYKNTGSMKLVMGYWIENSAGNSTPTIDNWFAIAHGSVEVKGSQSKLILANSNSAATEAGSHLLREMNLVMKQIKNSSSNGTYKLHTVALACNDFPDSRGVIGTTDSPGPTAAKIAEQLLRYRNGNLGVSIPPNSNVPFKIKVDIGTNTIDVSTVGGSVEVNNNYSQAAYSLISINADAATQVKDIRAALSSAIDTAKSVYNSCSTKVSSGGVEFWWESVPLQLTCKELVNADLISKLNALSLNSFADNDKVTEKIADFSNRKSTIIRLLLQAAALEQAQQTLQAKSQAELPRNKIGCMPLNAAKTAYESRFINKILVGLGVRWKIDAANPTKIDADPVGNNVHPEGGYAVGQYAPYRTNEIASLFMNGGYNPISINLNLGTDYSVFFSNGLVFPMNARGIGCSDGVIYCLNQSSVDKITR